MQASFQDTLRDTTPITKPLPALTLKTEYSLIDMLMFKFSESAFGLFLKSWEELLYFNPVLQSKSPQFGFKNLFLTSDCLSVLCFWVVADMAAVITGDVVKSHTDNPLAGQTVPPPRLVLYSCDHTQTPHTLAEVSLHHTCNLMFRI